MDKNVTNSLKDAVQDDGDRFISDAFLKSSDEIK